MANLAEFKRVAQEVVAEFGEDYIYPGSEYGACYYAADRSTAPDEVAPSCIIGQIAYRLDPQEFQLLVRSERGDESDGYISEADIVKRLAGADDPDVIDKVWETQRLQDAGVPWGQALEQGILSIEED